MPKISPNAQDQERESVMEKTNQALTHVKRTESTLVCGVGRKINVGDFENIDVYSSITLPLDLEGVADLDDLKSIIEEVAEHAFEVVSKETGQRYRLIKEKMRAAPRVEA